MRLPAVVSAALLIASTAAAADIEAPRVTIANVDWQAAKASIVGAGSGAPAEEFARLNADTGKRFTDIGKSSVPVLLPIDIDAFRADAAAGKPETTTDDKYFGPFHPTRYFLPGPAGYTGTFTLDADGGGFVTTYKKKPVEIEITGAGFTYDLDGPDHQEVFPVKDLKDAFPGIKRILRDAHVRYVFERFGVPYIVSIQCYDRRPSKRYLACREADPIAAKFLRMLHTAGGTPQTNAAPRLDLSEPQASSDFTYYGPGDLIPSSGWKKMPGRADRHVYAEMRFPIANAPAYVKSQSFMPWGDCYKSGHTGRLGRKGALYTCKVNGIPLVFDEAAAVNFTYPWRDNFCERRDFQVGQCPGGSGHQGEDIRPGNCVLNNEGADRCEPYQHSVAAVRDGLIWRAPGNLGAWLVINTPNEFVRFRYLHMNPKFMDADGLITGRRVSEGEIIGKVATWGDYENGTSYHLHFNMQVMTKAGWVWVNPYMSLVLAYEKQIGGRGTEIRPGDAVPAVPDKPPVILHPATQAEAKALETKPAELVPPRPTRAKARPSPPSIQIIAPEPTKSRKHWQPHKRRHRSSHGND